MEFYQVYDPLGNIWLSALVALSPIALFFVSLIVFKLKGYSAGFLSLVLSIIIALFVYKMPAQMVSASFFYGFLYGLWPIAWIVIAAIFLYNLSVKSGYFEILKESILSLTPDHRILSDFDWLLFWLVLRRSDWFWRSGSDHSSDFSRPWAKPLIRCRIMPNR
ncbi:hypothetical protein VN0355_03190 [Helicobacter pylori]|nr:hypothetical protein VN0355_03190 [Helicobacter pylori]